MFGYELIKIFYSLIRNSLFECLKTVKFFQRRTSYSKLAFIFLFLVFVVIS